MKRFLSMIMMVTILASTVWMLPMQVSATTDAQPDLTTTGTILVQNTISTSTSSTSDNFRADHNGTEKIPSTRAAAGTSSYTIIESDKTGYNGRTAIVTTHPDEYVRWYLTESAANASLAGTYDIWVYLPDLKTKEKNNMDKTMFPGHHVRYTVTYTGNVASTTTDNGKSVYYVNQHEVRNGEEGWFKLATHYFSCDSTNNYVEMTTDGFRDGGYASAMAFIPVDKPESTKLTNINMSVSPLSTANNGIWGTPTTLYMENSAVTSNDIVFHIPAKYGTAYGTNSDGNAYRRIFLQFQTEDKDAKIYRWDATNKKWVSAATGFLRPSNTDSVIGQETTYPVKVVSQDTKHEEIYNVSFVVEKDDTIDLIVENTGTVTTGDWFELKKPTNGTSTVETRAASWTSVTSGWLLNCNDYTKSAALYELGDQAKWTIPQNQLASGGAYYNVYMNSVYSANLYGETAEVIVKHAGLEERVNVEFGRYHLKNHKTKQSGAEPIYVGTFWFDGNGGETVTVMKNSTATTVNAEQSSKDVVRVNSVQLKFTVASAYGEDLDGIVLSSATDSANVTKEVLKGGNYILPFGSGDATIKVIGSNANYEYIKVNGTEVDVNTATALSVEEGSNKIKVEIKTGHKTEASVYEFVVWGENQDTLDSAVDSASLTKIFAPVGESRTENQVGYVKAGSASAKAAFEGDYGYYKVLAYKPGFDYQPHSSDIFAKNDNTILFESANQVIEIDTGAKMATVTADWTGTEGRWIDLGNYYFDGTANNGVSFLAVDGARPLLDTVKFLKLEDGIEINGEYVLVSELQDKVFYADKATVAIKNASSADLEIAIDDTTTTISTTGTIAVANGVNHVIATSGEETYSFVIIKDGTVYGWNEATNNADFNKEKENGYKSYGATLVWDDTATFDIVGTPEGNVKVYAYFVPADAGELIDFSAKAAVSVNGAAGVVVQPETAGWYEIGSYAFDGSDAITVTAGEEEVAYLSAIKVVPASANVSMAKPVIETGDATANGIPVTAWAYTYNRAETPGSAKMIIAVYDKATNQLEDCKITDCTLAAGFDTAETETIFVDSLSNVEIKAFVWDNFDNMKPFANYTVLGD